MDFAAALQIVIDLASQNVLSVQEANENDLQEERKRQLEAINMVEDMAVNQFVKEMKCP